MPNDGTFPADSRPNIAHLATIFVSFSDSSETHLSTGGIRRTFASKGKRRAGWDGLGEVKGPRDTAFAPPQAAAASPRVGRANGTVGATKRPSVKGSIDSYLSSLEKLNGVEAVNVQGLHAFHLSKDALIDLSGEISDILAQLVSSVNADNG